MDDVTAAAMYIESTNNYSHFIQNYMAQQAELGTWTGVSGQ